jgi:hypothetical protein
MTRNEVNIDDLVKENYVIPESIFDRKRTKTSHFMLNSVFPNSSLTTTEYFVNAFMDDESFKHKIIRPVFVLLKAPHKDRKWLSIQQKLRAKSEYVLEYFVGIQDGTPLTMMVFQVPDRFAKDYLYFKAGKYSKFSAEYKKLFTRYTSNDKAQPVESTIWRVIHKSEELKKEMEKFFNPDITSKSRGEVVTFGEDDELWGIPTPYYENYRHVKKEECLNRKA